jgi:hypothetical protein
MSESEQPNHLIEHPELAARAIELKLQEAAVSRNAEKVESIMDHLKPVETEELSPEDYITGQIALFQNMFDSITRLDNKSPEDIAQLQWVTKNLNDYQAELLKLHEGEPNE